MVPLEPAARADIGPVADEVRTPELPDAAELARLPPDGGPGYNRLVFEKSPYLLQHARNPVNWYPWGPEAFTRAKAENKPIFLSIGYSTCHWCHVMAHESFEDNELAALLNRDFVAIKVDREERPDIDAVYMTYVQATTGGGGWPLSVWLTPDLKPFFGGTYFPPDDRWGRPGFRSVLTQIAAAWEGDRERIVAAGEQVLQLLRKHASGDDASDDVPGEATLEAGYRQLRQMYDPEWGGFGGAPKFPRPSAPAFLLRYAQRAGSADALAMVTNTLHHMAAGGMHDQLGGGFHRYAVDGHWHVPHFEKMLYDQAQLAGLYLDAYQLTHDAWYAAVVRDILDYVERDLTGPEGEYYSAEDADSQVPGHPGRHAEGAFYVWRAGEIDAALPPADAAAFKFAYGVLPAGNVRSDPHGEFANQNVLFAAHTVRETADALKLDPAAAEAALARARDTLFTARNQRPRPHRDDKTITAWNGLMISAFARAGAVLGDAAYVRTAARAAAFLRTRLWHPATGSMLRRYRDGEAAIPAYAEDYACLIQGLLDLYEADFDTAHLSWAVSLQATQDQHFGDPRGGYFRTPDSAPDILVRLRESYDGAEPAASSVSALNLLRLAAITGDSAYGDRADQTLRAFGPQLGQHPESLPQMLIALDFAMGEPVQIVIAGNPMAPDTRAMLDVVNRHFLPRRVLLVAAPGESAGGLVALNAFYGELQPRNGEATAYVCRAFACRQPTTSPEELNRQLAE